MVTARFYGAEMVGVVAILNTFFTFSTIVTALGINTSILRLIPEYSVKYSPSAAVSVYKKAVLIIAIASFMVTIISVFSSEIIAHRLFSQPDFSFYFFIASFFIFLNAIMRFNTQAIRGLKSIYAFAIFQVMPHFFNLLFLVGYGLFLNSKNNPVYAYLASIAATGFLTWIIVVQVFKKKTNSKDVAPHIQATNILSVSLPMLMTATMGFIIGHTSVLVLGIYKNPEVVGVFSISVKLATLTSFGLQAINSIAAPKFSELFHSGNTDELFHVAKKSTRLIFYTSAPVLLGLVLFGKPILYYFFGDEFVRAYPSLLILIAGQFIGASAGSCGNFMNMTGHQIAFRHRILISSLINVTLNFILIPRFGVIGAAVSTSICTAYINITLLIFIKYKYGRSTGFLPFEKELIAIWGILRK